MGLPVLWCSATGTSALNLLPEHLVVPLDALNVVNVLQQDGAGKLQQRRSKGGGGTAQIQDGTFETRHDLRIVIFHPGSVEVGGFPPPGHDRFDLPSDRREHGEKDPPAVTARLITEHFQKAVIARWQAGVCPGNMVRVRVSRSATAGNRS